MNRRKIYKSSFIVLCLLLVGMYFYPLPYYVSKPGMAKELEPIVSVVKDMGADLVIAVNVAHVKEDAEVESIYDVIMQTLDILQMEVMKSRQIKADLMMNPRVEKYSSSAFTKIDEIVAIGEMEARKHIDQIKMLVANWEEGQKSESEKDI